MTKKVILLHGLGRTHLSMKRMERSLKKAGYVVKNINYPSRKYSIEKLCEEYIVPEIDEFINNGKDSVNFVTHSMGGIILRYLSMTLPYLNVDRAVMLAPPNRGSEIVDFLSRNKLMKKFLGPSFLQLSAKGDSFVNTLGDIDFELGIITGTRSINWINSLVIPGIDDGKVSVKRAYISHTKEFKTVKRTHPFIMVSRDVIEMVKRFLERGVL